MLEHRQSWDLMLSLAVLPEEDQEMNKRLDMEGIEIT